MKKKQIDSKILKSRYIPTSEFYSQIIDSLQDYSIFTLDKDLMINSWSAGFTLPKEKPHTKKITADKIELDENV